MNATEANLPRIVNHRPLPTFSLSSHPEIKAINKGESMEMVVEETKTLTDWYGTDHTST